MTSIPPTTPVRRALNATALWFTIIALVAAASALVLGLAAVALAQIGSVTSLEDLAQHSLPPEARLAVAKAFGYMFAAVAITTALGLAVFYRVEDRELINRAPIATTPAVD